MSLESMYICHQYYLLESIFKPVEKCDRCFQKQIVCCERNQLHGDRKLLQKGETIFDTVFINFSSPQLEFFYETWKLLCVHCLHVEPDSTHLSFQRCHTSTLVLPKTCFHKVCGILNFPVQEKCTFPAVIKIMRKYIATREPLWGAVVQQKCVFSSLSPHNFLKLCFHWPFVKFTTHFKSRFSGGLNIFWWECFSVNDAMSP